MNKIIMVILDGFGISDKKEGNAILEANMDSINELISEYPNATLETTGEFLGLPDDFSLDCETSHLIMGLGHGKKQDLTLVNEVLGSTLIEKNDKLLDFLDEIDEKNGTLHLAGLVSDGGIYSDITYIKNVISHLSNLGVQKLYFHAITDGIDVPSTSVLDYLDDLNRTLHDNKLGKIVSICGRNYALDTQNKWELINKYTNLLFNGEGIKTKNFNQAINACYKKNITDDNIPPIIFDDEATLKENDGLLWLNFRSDNARELFTVLTNDNFNLFHRNFNRNINIRSLLPITNIDVDYLINNKEDMYSLGVYLNDLNIKQARITTSDKFVYLTHFFNGMNKEKLNNCDEYLIPYSKDTDLNIIKSSMKEITDQAIKCMEKDIDFILINYPYPDILGNSGDMNLAVEGLKLLDDELKRLIYEIDNNFYKLILLSDHGNADSMIEDGEIIRANSKNPVPFIIRDKRITMSKKGNLTNVAPTILRYMDIAIPESMKESRSLLIEEE